MEVCYTTMATRSFPRRVHHPSSAASRLRKQQKRLKRRKTLRNIFHRGSSCRVAQPSVVVKGAPRRRASRGGVRSAPRPKVPTRLWRGVRSRRPAPAGQWTHPSSPESTQLPLCPASPARACWPPQHAAMGRSAQPVCHRPQRSPRSVGRRRSGHNCCVAGGRRAPLKTGRTPRRLRP